MTRIAIPTAIAATLFAGAIFGFFYAWVCSTMWGLDAAAPRVAIAAMTAMNGSVRNAVFAPAFFGTPLVLALAAALLWGAQSRGAVWFASAAALACVSVALTFAVNVPMNEQLALVEPPQTREIAQQIWTEYSQRWQLWNQLRTAISGAALLCAAIGLTRAA